MKKQTKAFLLLFTGLILTIGFSSCNGDPLNEDPIHEKPLVPAKLITPGNESQYVVGDILEITIEVNTPAEVKNLSILIDGVVVKDNIEAKTQNISITTNDFRVGYLNLKMTYDGADGKPHADSRKLIFFSDSLPLDRTVKVENSYPHSSSSYTQGLEFYEGEFYEGTGHYGKSLLTKIDLNSGTILKQHDLESKYFGEGITILNDTIFQITWNEHLCLLYDMDFNRIGQFEYSGEGWGLTNNGKHIIMTNGSSEIVWRDPHTFEIIKTLNAFDDQREVVNLNECELVDNLLYINVYTESYFVVVDTTTGKILERVDCYDLVSEQPIGADHLNGIAFNTATQKLYVTGKWWPKLYQITIE